MRWSLLLLLVAFSRLAFAEPKVAVAPLDGDDGKVAEVLADVASERAKITKPGRVEGAMRSMGVGKLSGKSLKKLRTKLDVDVVVYGTLEKDGNVKKLSLTFAGSGKAKLEIEFASEKSLRKELGGKVAKRIASAMEGSGGDEEEDEEDARAKKEEERKREQEARAKKEEEERKREEERKKREDDERAERKRRDDEERRKKDDDERRADRRKKRGDDEEDDNRRRTSKDDDEDGGRRKKRVAEDDEDSASARKRLGDEDEEDDEDRPRRKNKRERRNVLTQNALWLDGGGSFARRTLTYVSTGPMRPPPVGTAAPAGRITGEVYPAAFSSLSGAAAGFGVAGEYSRTFALGIAVPTTTVTTPITNVHYAIGARYRFVFGQHSLVLGISYWRRNFMADRAGLMNPDLLDMPDVDYKAVAPGFSLRIAAAPNVSAFATVDVPLMINSGPIQDPTSYGSAKILAFDVRAGSQIVIADHIAVQLAAEVEQVGLKFTGQAGSKSATRMVSAATDRSIGVSATIGITY